MQRKQAHTIEAGKETRPTKVQHTVIGISTTPKPHKSMQQAHSANNTASMLL